MVLSSGGARGLAHVGVIEALESRGYEIVELAGCSAGALVGGMYAAGKMAEFKEWICHLDRIDVFSLMDFTLSSRGFIKGEKVYNALKKVVEDCKIEELSIPFRCNAVEYRSGKEHVFKSGSLYEAIRASGSIPSVFQPARFQKMEFIDGGVLNPVPISLIQNPGEHLLVVSDVNGPEFLYVSPEPKDSQGKSYLTLPSWVKEYRMKMNQFFPEEKKEVKIPSFSAIQLLTRSFDLLQDRFCELLIEKYPVDVRVRISRKQAGTLEFHRSAEMIQIGRKKTEKALDQLEHGH